MKPHPDFDAFIKLNTPPELSGDCTQMIGDADCLEMFTPNRCASCQHYCDLLDAFNKQPVPFRPDHAADSHDRTNGGRANAASLALAAGRGIARRDEADLPDLLADLMHLAHRDDLDFETHLDGARRRFTEEQ